MELTDADIGRSFIVVHDRDESDRSLVHVIAKYDGAYVVGYDDSVNECWSVGIFNPDGRERGPVTAQIIREASMSEIVARQPLDA